MKYKYKNILFLLFLFLVFFFYYLLKGENNIEPFEDFLREGYVINLDERKDRWETITSKFDIPLQRIPAIKDKIGWKGCGYSHMKALKMAKEKGLSFILILEDDC